VDARPFRQTPAGCRLIPARPIPAVKYCDPASALSSSLKEYSSVPEIVIIAKRENRDNRIVFFFDDLPKGPATIAYRMIAQNSGGIPHTGSIGVAGLRARNPRDDRIRDGED